MALPKKFAYLESPDMPLIIKEALKLYGTWEWPGKEHNPVILGWAKALGIESIYKDDETAWCGLSAAYVLTRAKKFIPLKNYDLLRALKYKAFGEAVLHPGIGDVLVFGRSGGGHVGFYVGESKDTYFVLGGNQGNQFNITEIKKDRMVAARRPVYTCVPASVKAVALNASGVVSSNEA